MLFVVCCASSSGALPIAHAASEPINRKDAFLLLWNSAFRAIDTTSEKPFTDIAKTDTGYAEIRFAKARGIIDDDDTAFHPTLPVDFDTAMLWLFRTRSVEPLSPASAHHSTPLIALTDLPDLLTHYGLAVPENKKSMTEEQLQNYMGLLDGKLAQEPHEVSLYAEKFNGHGTAFGETFDMTTLTAAHRTFPHNTLVRVTNIANGKSVEVRINDRGPFVEGRDMDLSLAAFTSIADRSQGKFQATFQRLGDATMLNRCNDDRYQRRITKTVILSPGIPHFFPVKKELSIQSDEFFAVLGITYPDGTKTDMQDWISPHEAYTFTPSIIGNYSFLLRDKLGSKRTMTMQVVDCAQN